MKKTLVLTILLTSLVLAACGGQPVPAATEAPSAGEASSSAMAESSSAESHDDMASSEPAPTAMPTPAEAPATGADGKVQVTVTMGDNWIQSDMTTFKAGQTYVFNITNTGNRVHNFNINKPAAELTTSAIKTALDNALLHIPNEQLGPGAQVTVEYTFESPAAAGELEFSCLIERHYKSGQVLPIVVEP